MASALITILESDIIRKLLQGAIITVLTLFLNLIAKAYTKKIAVILLRGKPSQEQRIIGTRIKIVRTVASSIIFGIGIVLILLLIPGFRALSISLLAGAGILAIVIGFAAQKTLANIISGVSIAIYAPFRIGDKINVSGENGEVEDVNLRQTVIKTWDNKRIIIPNSIIGEKEVINYSLVDEKMLFTVDVGISYDSDIDLAKKIIIRLANAHEENMVFKAKDENNFLVTKEPYVRVTSLGDFSVNLRLYFWVKDNSKGFRMRHELLEQIKKEFDKNDIEIPFPYRTTVFKKDLEKKKKAKKKK